MPTQINFSNTTYPYIRSEIDDLFNPGSMSSDMQESDRAFKCLILDVLPHHGISINRAARNEDSVLSRDIKGLTK